MLPGLTLQGIPPGLWGGCEGRAEAPGFGEGLQRSRTKGTGPSSPSSSPSSPSGPFPDPATKGAGGEGAAPGRGPRTGEGPQQHRGLVPALRMGPKGKVPALRRSPNTGRGSKIGEGSQPPGRGLSGLPPLQAPPQETPEGFRDFPSSELWDRDSSHTGSHPGVLGCPRNPETRSAPKIPLTPKARSVPKIPFIPEIPSIPAQMELGRLDRVRRETEAGPLFPQLRTSQPGKKPGIKTRVGFSPLISAILVKSRVHRGERGSLPGNGRFGGTRGSFPPFLPPEGGRSPAPPPTSPASVFSGFWPKMSHRGIFFFSYFSGLFQE